MQYNHTIYKGIKYTLSLILILFMSVFSSFAQTHMTKIKDGTLSGTSTTPNPGAVLELESVNKGFLAPRLTTQQRDAISASNRTDGLLIYNKTTGCFNYWSTAQDIWLSMCGTPPPAVFEITSAQCNAIKAHGVFKQGEFLTAGNYLTIPVTVTQHGTYEITALTDNGYYFSAKGTFPSAGSYTLVLQGVGTPNIGYAVGGQGDLLTITLNNKTVSCQAYVKVENANVSYTVDCAQITVVGNYMIGQVLGDTHKMTLEVNVASTGYWSIATNTVNGYSFRGSGMFDAPGVQYIVLLGTGTPLTSGTNEFGLTTNSDADTRMSCTNIPVTVKNTKYTVDCTQVSFTGVYKQDEPVTASHTAKIRVNVTATGETLIKTNTVNGLYFTSGPLSLDELGGRDVVLTAVGTPQTSGSHQYLLESANGMEAICAFDLQVIAQPVSYSMNCQSITLYGTFAPGVPVNGGNRMMISVNVQYPGPYAISTNTVNGIKFEATGTFTTTGPQSVLLQATGLPLAGGTHRYTITTDSSFGANTCNKNIDFRFRTINILGLGKDGYQPGSALPKYTAKTMLLTSANFGPNGTVKVESLNIVNGANYQGTTLRNLINTNKIDVIIVGYNYKPTAQSIAVLTDFVKNKKGVLIHGQENDEAEARDLINAIAYSASTNVAQVRNVWTNPIINTTDPVIDGPFGNIIGKDLGNDLDNTKYVTGYSNEYTSISSQLGNSSQAHVLKHNTLGFIFIGDGGWMAGDASNTGDKLWPAPRTQGGLPISKAYYGGVTVYNSIFYANAVAWAIKYVQENTDVNYQVQ